MARWSCHRDAELRRCHTSNAVFDREAVSLLVMGVWV
jgi:hypothetical protein